MTKKKVLVFTLIGAAVVTLGLLLIFKIRERLRLPVHLLSTSNSGKNFIKSHEDLRLQSYQDTGGVWTIGWGHTSDSNLAVKPNQNITVSKAEWLFEADILEAERIVKNSIEVPITQNEFDALVSHTFNTGGSPGLFELVNSDGHSDDIYQWFISRYITDNGQVLGGLINRRREEAKMYFT